MRKIIPAFIYISLLLASSQGLAQTSFSRSLLERQQYDPFGQTEMASTMKPDGDTEFPRSGKAFMLSLLLPGAGEYYAGNRRMAAVFLSSEVTLWLTYGGFRLLKKARYDEATTWAAARAGIDLEGREHDLFVAVENYLCLRDYNEAKLRQRDPEAMYPEGEGYDWQWESDESRRRFEKLRIAGDSWRNRSLFVIGGILLNHLVSGIDAVRSARQDHSAALFISARDLPEGGFVFNLTAAF